MRKTVSGKARASLAVGCAAVLALGAFSSAFADGNASSSSSSPATTTESYITGAATRAAGPSLEILGLASVEESGQFVDTEDWYNWSYPKYYLCASDYNEELSPFLYNLANGSGTDDYPSAVLNTSRSGGGSGPNASLATDGSDVTDAAVWALDPDVIVGTGGDADYEEYGATGVSYSFSNYTSLVETMDAIAEAADEADADDSARTLRYGSAADIAQDYEEYVFGTIGAVAEAINDGTVETKTVALVDSVEDSEEGRVYSLLSSEDAVNDGTASTNRYLEATSDNGLGEALDLADNLGNTAESVNASELEKADLILVGGQQSSSNYDDVVSALAADGLLVNTYLVEDNGSAGAMYGVVMNSVENAQNVGRILGCLYPEVVDQQDWLAYYYETFYHIDSSELATVMSNALEGVRCWSVQSLSANAEDADAAVKELVSWEVSGTGYTDGANAESVADSIVSGYEYYEETGQDSAAASATAASASTASALSTASLSALAEDDPSSDTSDDSSSASNWTVKSSTGEETSYSTFSEITLNPGDTVTLNADVEEDVAIDPYVVTEGTSYTVDLAGHTITGKVNVDALDQATLTITSSAESKGTINSVYAISTSKTNEGALQTSSGNVNVSNIDINAAIEQVSSSYYGSGIYVTDGTILTLDDVDVLRTPYDGSGFDYTPACMYVASGEITAEDSSFITKAEGVSSVSGYINSLVLGSSSSSGTIGFTATDCTIGAETGEDTVSTSSTKNVRAIYSYYTDLNLTGCNVYTTCSGTRGGYSIQAQSNTVLSLDSCNLWQDNPNGSYVRSVSSSGMTSMTVSGDTLLSGKLGLGSNNQTVLSLVEGVHLIEPVTQASYYETFNVSLVSSTDEQGNTEDWTADEAEAIANMFNVTSDDVTYGAQVNYNEYYTTLPESLTWRTASATTTTATSDTSGSACEPTLSATVYNSSSETIEGATVSWVYYADEDCTQPLSEEPAENGTYYCKALYAGDYANSYLASISDAVEVVVAHTYGEGVVTAPTCTEGGYTTHTCTVCGVSYTDEETEATGHSYEGVVTAPTCTEGGYTTHTCTVCGDSYTDEETEATGHTYGETGVFSEDYKSLIYTCTVCESTYTIDVSAAYNDGYADATTAANDSTDENSAYSTGYAAGYAVGTTDATTAASDSTDENSAYSTGYAAGYAAGTTDATTAASDSTDENSAYSQGYAAGYAAGTAAASSSTSSSTSASSSSSKASKKAQSMKVTKKNKTVKAKKLKKKAQKVKAITVKNYKGKLSFKKVSGSKKLSLVKGGRIKVKKGTKKGTYKIKVKVTAAGNSSYKSASKTVTVTIKVK